MYLNAESLQKQEKVDNYHCLIRKNHSNQQNLYTFIRVQFFHLCKQKIQDQLKALTQKLNTILSHQKSQFQCQLIVRLKLKIFKYQMMIFKN
ncbi:unnamed protein product [Paramecium pentaurelia]|uniref:Uncharacterized protein n=1 Tax=Paramecium pentaurelia TaxID=43138 RepID=A0A8S1XD84_9CILI|nr:unnamed protein product [Paramecium pentaurelia]